MIAEVGLYALILAFLLALTQSTLPFLGAARRDPGLMAFGRWSAVGQGLFVALAFAALATAFVKADFSVALVANHAHSTQPVAYRFAATWGNHEGSMLLWILILSSFGAAVAVWGGNLRAEFQARVLGIQGMIGAAFLAFSLFTSNPFARLIPTPLDGAELNPLLQDPGLVAHPPLLYIGYVGFSVTFAFAVAALLEGRVDAAWARWVRPWVLAAWTSLTLGIALGSFWAYYELGWGGWWFWDPVENASLMPWLLGTALLHSALVLERRGALISWTILLAIMTFSLSLIGTFLVRSGILTSVHAFAVDATRGVYILGLIIVATGGALALFAWRAPSMKSGALFGAVSREGALTLNNLLLMAVTATVFLGTFYPVAMDAVGGDKISVGPPFYNATFAPIMAALFLLTVIGPMLSWKRDTAQKIGPKLRWTGLAALAALLGTLIAGGLENWPAALGFALAMWLIAGTFTFIARRWRLGEGGDWRRLARTTPLAVYGMALAHAGLGVTVAGITAMGAFQSSHILVMRGGETVEVGGVPLRLDGIREVRGPNYIAEQAVFDLGGKPLVSERRFYPSAQSQTTEAAIEANLLGNRYVAIGERQDGGIVVRAYHHPLVGWIWGGIAMLALGGMVSLSDRRFRIGVPQRAARMAAARGQRPAFA
jgi:cytochrome c-type biogenesis protein CcmF